MGYLEQQIGPNDRQQTAPHLQMQAKARQESKTITQDTETRRCRAIRQNRGRAASGGRGSE